LRLFFTLQLAVFISRRAKSLFVSRRRVHSLRHDNTTYDFANCIVIILLSLHHNNLFTNFTHKQSLLCCIKLIFHVIALLRFGYFTRKKFALSPRFAFGRLAYSDACSIKADFFTLTNNLLAKQSKSILWSSSLFFSILPFTRY